jgi:hypothetical protein
MVKVWRSLPPDWLSNEHCGNSPKVQRCSYEIPPLDTILSQFHALPILTYLRMKMTVFWDVAPCSLVEIDRRYRGAYRLLHQGYRGSKHPEDSHLQYMHGCLNSWQFTVVIRNRISRQKAINVLGRSRSLNFLLPHYAKCCETDDPYYLASNKLQRAEESILAYFTMKVPLQSRIQHLPHPSLFFCFHWMELRVVLYETLQKGTLQGKSTYRKYTITKRE